MGRTVQKLTAGGHEFLSPYIRSIHFAVLLFRQRDPRELTLNVQTKLKLRAEYGGSSPQALKIVTQLNKY